jgi:hypothetical protein
MAQIGRRFRLSVEPGRGVFCGEDGLFVGGVPLLERRRNSSGADEWQPRAAADLNRELHKHYGVPIEFERKMDGLGAICRALNRGDLIHAQIATLHLQIPEPVFTKAAQTPDAVIDLVRELRISGLLKQDWDPQKHPRWPAGSPDSVGGQFAPAGGDIGSSATETKCFRRTECTDHPGATYDSGTVRIARSYPISIRDHSGACYPRYQSSRSAEESVS